MIGGLHRRLVFSRRVNVLATHLAHTIPDGCSVLDIGCGSGELAQRLLQLRPDLSISGMDVLVRETTAIQVEQFDGEHIPRATASVDICLFVDVLHHTLAPRQLLTEAARVSKRGIVIKDHLADGFLARPVLTFMDWVGNAHFGVALPYNYLRRDDWESIRQSLNLEEEQRISKLGLYGLLAGLVFDRDLHFISLWAKPAD